VLAKALKGAWRPYAKDLIEPMAMTGLTDTLVRALKVRSIFTSSAGFDSLHALGSEAIHQRKVTACLLDNVSKP